MRALFASYSLFNAANFAFIAFIDDLDFGMVVNIVYLMLCIMLILFKIKYVI